MRILTLIVFVALMTGACSPQQNGATVGGAADPAAVTAADFDIGPVMSVDAYLSEPRFAEADVARGETLSLACIACHTLRPGADHMLGPNLGRMFGAAAASQDGFSYSAALVESGLVWTPRALDAWLAAPSSFVPGTSMVFAGYASADDRSDLIGYLLTATEPGAE
jgi:cytochrome c